MLKSLKLALGIPVWKEFTREEVAEHNTAESLWIIAGDKVFDITCFLGEHPAGPVALLKRGGGCADCQQDYKFHSKGARTQWKSLQVGVLADGELERCPPRHATPCADLIATYTKPLRYSPKAAGALPPLSIPTPATAILPAVVPTPPVAPSALPANPQQQQQVRSDEDDEGSDGGEDAMAAGHCCMGTAPTSACATCPHAPSCRRPAAKNQQQQQQQMNESVSPPTTAKHVVAPPPEW